MKRQLFFILCMLLFHLPGGTQDNRYMLKPAEIKSLPSSNLLTSIVQDSLGFIWIGSMNGLYRYDGFKTVSYLHDKEDSNSLSHNFVQSIVHHKQQLWISTFGAGINVLDLHTDKIKPIPPRVLGNDGRIILKVIRSDEDNCFWAASPGNIFRISDKGMMLKQYDLPLVVRPENRITDILSRSGELYICTGEELIILDKKTGSFKRPSVEAPAQWAPMFKATKTIVPYGDNLLVGGDNGVMWIGPGKHTPSANNLRPLNKEKQVKSMLVDQSKRIWIATDQRVVRYDDPDAVGTLITQAPEGITSMMEDQQENIWFTTQKQGVYRLIKLKMPFNLLPDVATLAQGTTINSLFEESDSIWLIGTEKGLLRHNRRSGQTQRISAGFPDIFEPVYGLYIDRKKRTWISSRKNGMRMKEDGGSFKTVSSYNPFVSGTAPGFMFFFYEDEKGTWGGFYTNYNGAAGLYLYDEVQQRFLQQEPRRKDTAFTLPYALSQIVVDQQHKRWWLGSWNGGLFNIQTQHEPLFIEDNIGIRSAPRKRLSLEIISSVLAHRNGSIYCGTVGGGINTYDPIKDTTINYTITDGLASNLVYRMEEDHRGVIWISTDNGISAFDPKTEQFTNFHTSSGLGQTSFSFIASMKTKDGTIAFGTNNGHVVYFNPDHQSGQHTQSIARITDIRLGNRSLSHGQGISGAIYLQDTIVLKYKDAAVISIDLTNMDLTDPSVYAFEYRLEGFDKNWTKVTDRNTITYTNLDPGSYTLQIKTADHMGQWTERTRTLYLKILPPFWRTPWFYLLLAAISALAIYLLFQYQLRQKLRMYQLRNKLHRDLHDDVGATLSSIKAYADILRRNPENPVIADLIKDNSEEMIDRLEVISWAMKPEHDRFISLYQHMEKLAVPLCRAKDIAFASTYTGLKEDEPIPAEFRQNIFLIFKEALNNAIKYSGARNIRLRHIREGAYYRMELEDDGTGIDADRQQGGNGLRNMKNRAEEIQASFDIVSGSHGTLVRIGMNYPLQLPRTWGIGKK